MRIGRTRQSPLIVFCLFTPSLYSSIGSSSAGTPNPPLREVGLSFFGDETVSNTSVDPFAHAATCVDPTSDPPGQFFGIDVYTPTSRPNMLIPHKKICMQHGPVVSVKVAGVRFNLLNVTISADSCRDFYSQTLCENLKHDIPNMCEEATKMVFAMLQQIVPCKDDADCLFPNSQYVIPDFSCILTAQLQHDLCLQVQDTRTSVPCEHDEEKSTRIRDVCAYTNDFCRFVISQRHIISPLLGISIFAVSVCIVLCSM